MEQAQLTVGKSRDAENVFEETMERYGIAAERREDVRRSLIAAGIPLDKLGSLIESYNSPVGPGNFPGFPEGAEDEVAAALQAIKTMLRVHHEIDIEENEARR